MTALRTAIRQDLGLDWPEETPSTDPAPEQPETGAPAVASLEELREKLTRAIAAAEQPPAFDVSALDGQEELPLTVKNLYYDILSGNRTYSYAYDLHAEVGADGLLSCTISYMHYRTCLLYTSASCWPRPRRSWPPWRSAWTSPSPAPWPDRAAYLTGTP